MPAPKQFKPGPETNREHKPESRPMVTKGRYAVVVPERTIVEEDETIEVAVDDVTVVMPDVSKYAQRSFRAYGDVGSEPEEGEDDAQAEAGADAHPSAQFGEWRTESTLEGARYRRKDSRLT